jgi:hypothetical protein
MVLIPVFNRQGHTILLFTKFVKYLELQLKLKLLLLYRGTINSG